MILFLGFYLVVLLFSSANRNIRRTHTNFILVSFCFIFFCLTFYTPILSENHSRDYPNYLNFYINDGVAEIGIERFYIYAKRLLHFCNMSSYAFFYFICFISIYFIFNTSWKVVSYPFLAVFLYLSNSYFVDGVTTIRSGLSAALCLTAIYQLDNDNKKRALLYCVFALCTHYMGILSFVIFLLKTNTFNKKRWTIILLLSFIFSYINILNLLKLLLYLPLPSAVSNKLLFYLNLTSAISNNTVNVFSVGNLIQTIFILVYIYKMDISEKNNIYLKVYILSLFFLCVFSKIDTIPFRIHQYFYISEIILYPLFIDKFKKRENKYLIYCFSLLYGLFRIYMHYRSQTLI